MKRDVTANRINALVKVYGSLCKVSEALDIDKAYLSRLKSGTKNNPSDNVLKKLGLKKIVKVVE